VNITLIIPTDRYSITINESFRIRGFGLVGETDLHRWKEYDIKEKDLIPSQLTYLDDKCNVSVFGYRDWEKAVRESRRDGERGGSDRKGRTSKGGKRVHFQK
jgi:hypothetical protein